MFAYKTGRQIYRALLCKIITGLLAYSCLTTTLWAAGGGQGICKNQIIFTPVANLSFGAFASSAGGQVNVAYTGIRTTDAGTGITLLGGTVSQGAYTLTETSCANKIFSVILPLDTPITDGGANTMTLTAFTSYPVGSVLLDAFGQGLLQVGASLVVGYPQVPGAYSGTFIVEIVLQ